MEGSGVGLRLTAFNTPKSCPATRYGPGGAIVWPLVVGVRVNVSDGFAMNVVESVSVNVLGMSVAVKTTWVKLILDEKVGETAVPGTGARSPKLNVTTVLSLSVAVSTILSKLTSSATGKAPMRLLVPVKLLTVKSLKPVE